MCQGDPRKPGLKLSLITGVNLPMLLETALNSNEDLSLEELSLKIRDIGREQIKTLSEIIK